MKTQKLKYIILAFGAVILTSCSSMLYTSLDVLRPAKVAFKSNASNLLIINNSAIQPANYGHKTALINEAIKNVAIPTDSLSLFCLGALTEDLEGKEFFSSVQLIPNSRNKSESFSKLAELNKDSVKSLCSKYNANVILSLDNIKVNDDLEEYYLYENSTFLATLELKFETTWSIHYLNGSRSNSVQFKDTVDWESESYYRKKAMSDIPNRADALIDGALTVGHNSTNRFVPYWDKVDRYFFNPRNKLMRQGMDSVYVKNWKSAISFWKKADKETDNTKIRAQATNNIAIGYEIIGDIDQALDYASKSYNLFGEMTFLDYNSLYRLTDYIKELAQRKSEINILKQQLGE